MLLGYNDFATIDHEGLAICGTYCGSDSIHVGLYWNYGGERKIIHFANGDNIPVQDFDYAFQQYYFNQVTDFPVDLLPSLSALAELISHNSINGFQFNRFPVVYDGGKFKFLSGEYEVRSPAERVVNCAVFVIALLNTYDYQLLNWNSWPNISTDNRQFLEPWLEHFNIPMSQREQYYQMAKEVRGKHVIVCPDTESSPSEYEEAESLANLLIDNLR